MHRRSTRRDYVPKLKHLIAREVFPNYSTLRSEIRRIRQIMLGAAVNSLKYETSDRKRRGIRASG